ncbi:PepSY-associated TM helix domain-containing protein [Bowmanella dokdonensis]|uniref:PepSY-associated TM helix domain-containing protein n=1 Tax=Bowmanella dokdonensis TaxID=751969 RepID=A0A939DMD9_9ALTE|nr:PepSY-associated TM helix domain-containing protein [Bowmanella dokdonensis]
MARKSLRSLYQVCRWLHIYLSTALFGLLLFFCISGLVLNHMGWLEDSGRQGQLSLPMPTDWQRFQATPVQLMPLMQDYLYQEFSLRAPRSTEWDADMQEILFDYAMPAGYALVSLDLASSTLTLEYHQGNWLGVWADLHKGRHSGEVWSWIIDLSAVLMLLFALTGLIILFQNRAKWRTGLLAALTGIITPLLFYYLCVPAISGV